MKQKAKFGFKKTKKMTLKQIALDPNINKADFTADLIETVIKKAAQERQQALVAEIYRRLAELGHVFEGDTAEQDSKDFFRDRLKIARDNGNNCYVYLDYIDNENRGALVIWYNENMEPEVKIERSGAVDMKIV